MRRLIVCVLISAMAVPSARAASQDECAIWLCLPVGFAVPGCSKAFSAMYKRLIRFKGPAPMFNSCLVRSENSSPVDDYKIRRGQAVLMGPYMRGTQMIQPANLIIHGWCNHRDSGEEEPRGCIRTLQTIKVYKNGVQMGNTYYRDKLGQDYMRDPETGILYFAGSDVRVE